MENNGRNSYRYIYISYCFVFIGEFCMSPIFYLGLSIGLLMFPLGFVLGFNMGAGEELKKFNEKKLHILTGVIE